MAITTDSTADRPSKVNPPPRRTARTASRNSSLEDQVVRLQEDLHAITQTLARMGEDRVSDVRRAASSEVKQLVKSGKHAVDEVQDEFGQLEKQARDTIREKPLTAVAGAIALGFLLAALTRQ